MIAARCAGGADLAEWLAALAPIVADAGGSLWELADAPGLGGPGPGHSHVVWIEGRGSLTAYDQAVDRLRADDLANGHAEVRRDHWAPHGERIVLDDVAAEAMIVAEVMSADPGRHDEWDEWYDAQHLPDMLASGAFTAGHRRRRDPWRPGGTNDLTVYEIAGISTAEAVARSAAAMPALIAAGRKPEYHVGGPTMVLRRVT